MIITQITQETLTKSPLYYSRWHSCSTAERGKFYDIKIGGLVGPILSMGLDTFIVCIFLTELIDLGENYTLNDNGFKIWDNKDIKGNTAGTMYLEDNNGIRYFGTIEAMSDKGEEGLKVFGTSCLFTDNLDDAYIESFFLIRDLIPKKGEKVEDQRDYRDAENFVRMVEPLMREELPEKFI